MTTLPDGLHSVPMNHEPDPTHRMTEWTPTICNLPSNDRFGRERECRDCGSREMMCGGAGSRWQDPDLSHPCEAYPIEQQERFYREQSACANCRFVFALGEYDAGDDYFCTWGAPPRPRSGSVAMGETFQGVPNDEPTMRREHDAWVAWSTHRHVEAWGICDRYQDQPPDEEALHE